MVMIRTNNDLLVERTGDGYVVVTLPVEIDVLNAPRVREQLLQLINLGARGMILDATATRFCDCAGVSAFIRAHTRATAMPMPFVIVAAGSGSVRKILTVTGVCRLIPVASGLEAALSMAAAQAEAAAPAGRHRGRTA
jgi:anti-sigma B factor antagonist